MARISAGDLVPHLRTTDNVGQRQVLADLNAGQVQMIRDVGAGNDLPSLVRNLLQVAQVHGQTPYAR